ncbi:MAG TPA: phasin family protein [Gammaproteobacteria bacterium]|nr:phasin family protein [Gammaproteobacteria bacterium]
MYTQVYDIMNKVTSEAVSSLRQATDLNLKSSQKLLAMQADWAQQAIKFGVEQTQLLVNAHEPRTYVKEQSTLVGDYMTQCLNNSQELVSALTSSSTEVREWVEQGVEKAQVNLRKASAKKAA